MLTEGKTLKVFENYRLSALLVAASLRFFVDVNLLFSNIHFKCIMLGHVMILMSALQCVQGYMVTLKYCYY